MADLAIGGILVVGLILGLVEFSKRFGLSGNWLIGLAFTLAVLLSALAMLISDGTIPPEVAKWIIVGVASISFGLGIPGLYDLRKADLERSTDIMVIEATTSEAIDDADAPEVASTADEALAAADEAYDRGFADAKKAAKKSG